MTLSARHLALMLALGGPCLGLGLAAAHAESEPPVLDIERTCNSPGRIQVGTSLQESRDGCLRTERAARDEVRKRWGEFSPAAKTQCSNQATAGGFPSYVETVTCLELASGTAPGQTGDRGAKGAKPLKGSELTAEPSASQRTNPIEVLENKP